MKNLIAILTLIAGFSAHAIDRRIEPLLGAYIKTSSVKIQVESNGCTWKKSFVVNKQYDRNSDVMQILIVRMVPDLCEGYFPEGKTLVYSFEELGLQRGQNFQIVNPLAVHRVPDDVP